MSKFTKIAAILLLAAFASVTFGQGLPARQPQLQIPVEIREQVIVEHKKLGVTSADSNDVVFTLESDRGDRMTAGREIVFNMNLLKAMPAATKFLAMVLRPDGKWEGVSVKTDFPRWGGLVEFAAGTHDSVSRYFVREFQERGQYWFVFSVVDALTGVKVGRDQYVSIVVEPPQ